MGLDTTATTDPTAGAVQGASTTDRRRQLLLSLPLLLLVAAGLVLTSTALYSDVANVTDNTIATGSLDLTAAPATQAYNVSAMAPGDVEYTKITLTNSGTLELRHSMLSTTTADVDGLAAELDFQVAAIGSAAACANQTDFDAGTQIYTTTPGVGGPLGSGGGTAIYGDATQGQDGVAATGGDRTLAGAAAEGLCLRVELPDTIAASFSGSSTTVTFRFDAEQTANNA